MSWADIETQVRKIAETQWNAPCVTRIVSGIRSDGIIEVRSDYWVAIEVTKRDDLAKLREDIQKLSSIRMANFLNNIFTECYFVTAGNESSLKETGAALNISVLSVDEFATKFIGKSEYYFNRKKRPFGSAVDPETGLTDTSAYAPVTYISDFSGEYLSVAAMSKKIELNQNIILLGEFGSGKSRCINELFNELIVKNSLFPVIAINLRECWGLMSFDLILRSHLNSLGLSTYADNIIKLAELGKVRFLLDGFDEIGSQSWTGEADRLKEIRMKSLSGIRDLIRKCGKSGVLICGREHYFSSNEEMLECLGFEDNALIVKCPEEFSDEELSLYLKNNTSLTNVPSWMPRKPLICQLFSKLPQKSLENVTEDSSSEATFFENFLDAICKREKEIRPTIDQTILKKLLLSIAELTREKSGDYEEISPTEINNLFFDISGHTPIDESAIMLQRLPYLGRVGSGNPNRMFIDDYAKSGLRGISLSNHIHMHNKKISNKKWIKPTGSFGDRIIESKISNWSDAFKFGNYCSAHGNTQVSADMISARLTSAELLIDFSNIESTNAHFYLLDFSGKEIKRLRINRCYSDELVINETIFTDCIFNNLIGYKLSGIVSKDMLPDCFDSDCEFDSYSSIENTSRISELPLTNSQKTLVAIIKKLFFQKGRGRKEDALLRGTSAYWDDRAAGIVIRHFITNKIVVEGIGDQGRLYIPQRRHTKRMANIIESMTSSDDEIWKLV